MVIGNGPLSRRFADYSFNKQWLIFAGQTSAWEGLGEFQAGQEEKCLTEFLGNINHSGVVYFSTALASDTQYVNDPFVQYHLKLEGLVRSSGRPFIIFRIPEVFGFSNDRGQSLETSLLTDSRDHSVIQFPIGPRLNILDCDDIHEIVHQSITNKNCLNLTLTLLNPVEINSQIICDGLCKFWEKQIMISSCETKREIDLTKNLNALDLRDFNLSFSKQYFQRQVEKYWAHLKNGPRLFSLIVPTYNEEKGIKEFYTRSKAVLDILAPRFDYEMIFVNDFSTDKTWEKLEALAKGDSKVRLLNFSRNFGNQMGITAGMDHCKGDLAVIIDDDLQDPPEQVLNLLSKWYLGYPVVYGVRPNRAGVNPIFKLIAMIYYRVIGWLSEIPIHNDTGDFRLIDRKAIDVLCSMKEENRYYRGMVSWVGFPQYGWLYQRDPRFAGRSTFRLKKYVNFAFNGLTSFTEKPLYFSSIMGFGVTLIGFVFLTTLVISKILYPATSIRGWTSLMALVVFFGGVQLISIGVLGIYLSKIYREVKKRPLYVIQKKVNL